MNKKINFLTLCLLFCLQQVTAQSTTTEKVVLALFAQEDKVEWCKHFHGRIDDLNEITVSLAFDGKKCKGMMTYLRSREAVQLQGVIKNNLINLEEISRDGSVSAKLKGELRGKEIFAEWTNFNQSLAGNIYLQEVKKEVEIPGYCGEDMWIRRYEGELAGQKMPVILQRVEEGQLRGIAYLKDEGKSFRLVGEMDEDNNFRLFLQAEDYKVIARINGKMEDIATQRALFQKTNGKEQYLLLNLKSSLYMGCAEYADYLSSYDITFPRTTNIFFNIWMEKEVDDWMDHCQQYARSVKEVNPRLKPQLRSSVRAYGWSDVDYLSDKLISGFLTFNDTWSLEPQGKPFNFNLVEGKEIFIEDIFKKEFHAGAFARQYLKDNMHQYSWSQDVDFRKWLSGQDFSSFTIREEGICFGTQFSMLYGRYELTIPYQLLKPYLKKRSPITALVN